MTTFQVGDTVKRYKDHHDTKPRQHTIVRMTKRTVILDNDGGTFDLDGDEWGRGSRWFYAHITKAEEETK